MENKSDQRKLKTTMNIIDKIVRVCIVAVTILLLISIYRFPWNWLENKGYMAYKYAMEQVKNELAYPNTAKLPSFTKVSMQRNLPNVNRWDISGFGTCENALGMTVNFQFTVMVVVEKSGEIWCYECIVDFWFWMKY